MAYGGGFDRFFLPEGFIDSSLSAASLLDLLCGMRFMGSFEEPTFSPAECPVADVFERPGTLIDSRSYFCEPCMAGLIVFVWRT